MECQECHQRPATLHYTQVSNGNKHEVHVCEVCAKEKGYILPNSEEGYSLHDLLKGLFNFENPKVNHTSKSPFQTTKEIQCPSCGMTLTQFKRISKFGCAECYHTFSDKLDPIFRRVHNGNIKHAGKIPKRRGGHLHLKKQLDTYKEKLRQLIENEAFEDAAVVRDQIRDLESQIRNKEAGDEV
ncbi:UvrB/UvrC motif-containing protein [Virgibacillus soli]|uniref:UvrB/UvrC motif-containing protein n=1 Tax=Paracerasibacillus soli TaxID=480284 RepID=UPI0035EECE0E